MNQAILRKNQKALFTVYSKNSNEGFSVITEDENGKPYPKINPMGGPLILNNKKQFEEESWTFLNIDRSSHGGRSIFPVYEDFPPPYVAKKLRALADDSRHVDLQDQEAFEKEQNPQAYKEKKIRKEAEKKISQAKEEARAAKEEARASNKVIAEMQKKLDKLEKKA